MNESLNVFRGNLDMPPSKEIRLGAFNLFSGWVFGSQETRIVKVEVFHGEKLLGNCEYGLKRKDVYETYPEIPQAAHSGFLGWVIIPWETSSPVIIKITDERGQKHTLFQWEASLKTKISCAAKKLVRLTRGAFPWKRKEPLSSKNIPKKILIIGLAKSGTTALFFKIANSLSYYGKDALHTKLLFEPETYSFLDDERVLTKIVFSESDGFLLEKEAKQIRPVRYEDFDAFDKKILLIRDPRDRLISSLLYSVRAPSFCLDSQRVKSFLRLLRKKEKNPWSVSVSELIRARIVSETANIESWSNQHKKFLDLSLNFYLQNNDYFVYKYEDLVQENTEELEAFLGFPLPGDTVVDNSFDRVVRTKNFGDWKNWFLKEDISFFMPIYSSFMRELGYESDWSLPKRKIILPTNGSGYVERILQGTKKIN